MEKLAHNQENVETLLRWRNKILEIAEKQKEATKEVSAEKVAEKFEKNQHFLISFLKETKLFINKAIGLQRSKLSKAWNNESTKDIKSVFFFVFGYGILGYTVLLTFSDKWMLGYWTGLHIFGVGSGIYLFTDLFEYVVNTIKGRR